jgi:hypothetical protein
VSEPRPARVRVTGPPTRRRRPPPATTDAETPLGSLYVGSLVRAQRAAAIRTLALLAATVGALPLVFHLLPGLTGVRLLGVPLAWLVVGVATYPVLLVLGWRHLRRAERVERDYLDLVRPEREP